MRVITAGLADRGTVGADEAHEPPKEDGGLLVRGRPIGACGADREIAGGKYAEAPPAETRLIIDHEGLGEVLEAPRAGGYVAAAAVEVTDEGLDSIVAPRGRALPTS